MKGRSAWLDIVRYMSWLVQLGVSVVTPVVLCLLAGLWLQERFSLGSWVVLVGLAVGLLTGASVFMQFLRYAQREADRKRDSDRY